MTPLSGWLAGRIGRKRVFLFSVVGFTIASALCGLAQSLPQIVAVPHVPGALRRALIPMSQAILLDINPPEEHGRAMAIWVMGVTIGPILGPALGGWLTDHYNWRWVFYINVPFGILSFLGILAFMPETTIRRSRFDFFGFATLSLAIGALAADARPRPAQGLVQLDRDLDRSDRLRRSRFYLFVVHSSTTTRATVRQPRPVQGPQFRHRQHFHLRRRRRAVRDAGAAAAAAAGSDGLSGRHRPGSSRRRAASARSWQCSSSAG